MGKVKTVIFTIIAVVLSSIGLISSYASPAVYAEETKQSLFENQNVLEDLKGSTIEGEAFDLTKYNFDDGKAMKLMTLAEFCYSFKEEKQKDYGLYAYVYNPQGKAFNFDSEKNEITIRAGGEASASFTQYRLKFLNQSTQAGYEGLFIKFRVELSESQKQDVLKKLNSGGRVYEVGEVQLMRTDKDFEVTSGAKYTYTGYAEGYGSESAEGDTLSCKVEGGLLTLSLDVHSTAYRPEGSNGKNAFTQDSLHSVYFAVPNEMIEKYGEMVQIHAKWLNATLKPGLVTGNREAYEKLLPIVARQITMSNLPNYEKDGLEWKYRYCGDASSPTLTGVTYYDYGLNGIGSNLFFARREKGIGEELDLLPILLYASNGNADHSKFESTDELLNYIKNYPNVCPDELDPLSDLIITGGSSPSELVAGKYPTNLFSKWDKEYTEKWVKSTEKITLENYKVDKTWWSHLLGLPSYDQEKQPFESYNAIQAVKASDLIGSSDEISKRLAVGKADLPAFNDFYEENKAADKTVFLFRFYQGEFMAQEATLFAYEKNFLGIYETNKKDTNAYFFQTDVNLNFDIIDITYKKGYTFTTIPVVFKPIDVVPDPTPPIITTPDFKDFWKYGLSIMGGLALIGILAKIIEKGAR